MIQQQLTNLIKSNFKTNVYQSDVLAFLFINKSAIASHITKGTNVPRARVYDICMSLNKLGFIDVVEQKKDSRKRKFTPITFKIRNIKDIISSFTDSQNKQAKLNIDLFKISVEQVQSILHKYGDN